MGRQTIDREIDGQRYRIQQFGATDSRNNLIRLAKLIAAGSVGAARGVTAEEGLAFAAERVFQSLDLAEVDEMVRAFAKHTKLVRVADTGLELPTDLEPIFEDHFADRVMAQFDWIATCLEVNYQNFIKDIQNGQLTRLRARMSFLFQSQQDAKPTGPSIG